jgi:hypothetical protein
MTLGSLDALFVTAGIALLIVRQFLWRTADPQKILQLPLAILGIGIVSLGWDLAHGLTLTGSTLVVVAAEIALVSLTGVVMGWATQLTRRGEQLAYRLSRPGILLWALFIGIRVGSFVLAARLGVHLLETTGAILISFGFNRLLSSLVVRRKVRHYLGAEDSMNAVLEGVHATESLNRRAPAETWAAR